MADFRVHRPPRRCRVHRIHAPTMTAHCSTLAFVRPSSYVPRKSKSLHRPEKSQKDITFGTHSPIHR